MRWDLVSQRATEYVPAPLSYEPEPAPGAGSWEGVRLAEIFRILRRRVALIILTTIVLYLLACDPLPPCRGLVKEWLMRPSSVRSAASQPET